MFGCCIPSRSPGKIGNKNTAFFYNSLQNDEDLLYFEESLRRSQSCNNTAGSLDYDTATKKIEQLEAAIKAFEDAREAQKGAKPDSPE